MFTNDVLRFSCQRTPKTRLEPERGVDKMPANSNANLTATLQNKPHFFGTGAFPGFNPLHIT
jgi:hypothetical protein